MTIQFQLRDYQETAVSKLRQAFADGHVAPLYRGATGSGKTVIFSYIAKHAAALGTRICILVHRRELLLQASRALSSWEIPHGIIAPGYQRINTPVQVASVQTLVRRSGHEFDLLIIDECHHSTATTYRSIFHDQRQARLLGVTATPCRMSGAGLGTIFDTLIEGPTIKQLTDQGHLSPAIVYAPPTAVNLSGIRSRAGDYDKEKLAALMDSRQITGCAVSHYVKLCNGYPAIAFCASVDHAKHVAEDFRAAGFRAASVDGAMAQDERDDAIASLGDGRLNVLTSCDLISEGVDVPVVSAAILLRPTMSLSVYLQQVGRVLRPFPGKKAAIILDHVGNVIRHGLPGAEREWSLEEGVVKPPKSSDDEYPKARQCHECFAVHDYAPVCPECGFIYPVVAKKPPKQVDGELKLVSQEEGNEIYKAAKTLAEFHEWARSTGKKPGAAWFAHKRRMSALKQGKTA